VRTHLNGKKLDMENMLCHTGDHRKLKIGGFQNKAARAKSETLPLNMQSKKGWGV
jgi:hypothetical protein